MRHRSDPSHRSSLSLYAIIEKIQRRLERQGLSAEVVDRAVVYALASAARAKA